MDDAIAGENVRLGDQGPKVFVLVSIADLEFPVVIANDRGIFEFQVTSHQGIKFHVAVQFVLVIDFIGCMVEKNRPEVLLVHVLDVNINLFKGFVGGGKDRVGTILVQGDIKLG